MIVIYYCNNDLHYGLYYKHVMIVIYYCNNDLHLHYINILACTLDSINDASRVISYVAWVMPQIVASLTIVSYDCNVFIVEATNGDCRK